MGSGYIQSKEGFHTLVKNSSHLIQFFQVLQTEICTTVLSVKVSYTCIDATKCIYVLYVCIKTSVHYVPLPNSHLPLQDKEVVVISPLAVEVLPRQ